MLNTPCACFTYFRFSYLNIFVRVFSSSFRFDIRSLDARTSNVEYTLCMYQLLQGYLNISVRAFSASFRFVIRSLDARTSNVEYTLCMFQLLQV
jgi:hypothetical protein